MNDRKLVIHAGICDELKDLYRRKNADYGDSFGSARRVIAGYTAGKLYDKLSRYIHLTRDGADGALVDETLEDTLLDLANYAVMELTERRLAKEGGGDCAGH